MNHAKAPGRSNAVPCGIRGDAPPDRNALDFLSHERRAGRAQRRART